MINLNKKKIALGSAIMLMVITAVIVLLICLFVFTNVFNSKISNIAVKEQFIAKFNQINDIIATKYVNEKIDYQKMQDYAFYGFVAGLGDKYSTYYNTEEFKQLLEANNGNMVGIGVSVIKDKASGNIKIIEVYENSPALVAGLQSGDLITVVEGKSVSTEGYEASINSMLGKTGQPVNFKVNRNGADIDFTIMRAPIKVNPISYKMLTPDIGYIRIKDFTSNTFPEFENALNQVNAAANDKGGLKGIVFDVRNNTGGTLDSIVKVLDKLLPEGNVVKLVSKEGKEQLFKSDASEVKLPMIVLTNEYTASASELFTGALKDYKKADVVGTKTYGKGCAQGLFQLKDGSGLVLTDQMYYTPSGRNFEGNGNDPDYLVEIDKTLINQLFLLEPKNDPQLTKGLEVLTKQIQAKESVPVT